jgi:hypothetical protein
MPTGRRPVATAPAATATLLPSADLIIIASSGRVLSVEVCAAAAAAASTRLLLLFLLLTQPTVPWPAPSCRRALVVRIAKASRVEACPVTVTRPVAEVAAAVVIFSSADAGSAVA